MKFQIELISAILIKRRNKTDSISIRTNFPSPYKILNNDKLYFDFTSPKDEGVNYIKELFPGLPIEIVEEI